MSTESPYFRLLTRTDHPVYNKDFSDPTTGSSPFNSILNRVLALQIEKFIVDLNSFILNSYPNTCDASSINDWEYTYFGFIKVGAPLATRITQLLQKINNPIGMSVNDVITLAQTITGLTPVITRNIFFDGWTLDVSTLDIDTNFPSTNQSLDGQTYFVTFLVPVDGGLLSQLDAQLTVIEKGGSTHRIFSPINYWVLDDNTLDIDTTLE
jgi:hypothetical protein